MDARFLTVFYFRLLLLTLLSWPLFAAQSSIVLVAEKNTSAVNKLLYQLSEIAPGFSYSVSTRKNPATVDPKAYVIVVGAKPSTHFDFSKYPNRIAVMVTAKQSKTADVNTSIFIEPPLTRQLKLANLLIPGNKKLGLLVSNAQDKHQVLMTLTESEKDLLKIVNIADYENINQALFHVLKGTRLLLGNYNNEIYNAKNIKNILITSYRQQKVLVGPSRAYLKAGSFATTFSDLSHIARRIIDVVQHHQKSGEWLQADYNPYYRILFNTQVARSLNIRVLNNDVLLQKMEDE
jgi:hypothetical protein